MLQEIHLSTYFRNSNVKLKNTQLQLMKRFSFRTILPLLGIFAVLSMANSCQEPLPEEPGMTLSAEEVQVSAEGGLMELPYDLTGFDGVPEIKAVYDADWIDGFDFSEEGLIRFNVLPTDSREQRSASVRLVVPGFGVESSFNVIQYEGEIPDLAITTYGLVENRIYYNVTPFDKDMTYIVLGCEKSRVADFTTDEQWYEADKEYFAEKYPGADIKEILNIYLKSGNARDEVLKPLVPGTEYCIYAYGMTIDGKPTTSVSTYFFKTPELELISPKFDFDIQVDGYDVVWDIIPEDKNLNYVYGLYEKAKIDELGMDLVQYHQQMIDNQLSMWELNTPIPIESIVDSLSFSGDLHITQECEPTKEYVACVMSISSLGIINSELISETFWTEEVQESDNEFVIEFESITSNLVEAKVDTSNDDPYGYVVCPLSDLDGLTDDQIEDKLLSEYKSKIRKGKGDKTLSVFSLTPDTDYMFMVFGYDYEVINTDITKKTFKTLAQ